MKFRRLTITELEFLTQDFIHFLAANGLPAEEWERIKKEDTPRMNQLLDTFSEMVFQTTIDSITHLQLITAESILLFDCGMEQLKMTSITAEQPLDFTQYATSLEAIQALTSVSVFEYPRTYRPDRETEIFQLLESGCGIIKQDMYATIINLLSQKNNK